MGFIRVWFTGYYNPVRMIYDLRTKLAPRWDFFEQLPRALLDSLLSLMSIPTSLPLAIMFIRSLGSQSPARLDLTHTHKCDRLYTSSEEAPDAHQRGDR